jgi:hypothetical protein
MGGVPYWGLDVRLKIPRRRKQNLKKYYTLDERNMVRPLKEEKCIEDLMGKHEGKKPI